jgi:hypothetical protein
MTLNPSREQYSFWRDWFKTNFPNDFEDASNQSSPKQAVLNRIFRILDINRKDYEHGQKRGVYICPLYHNYKEFLRNEIEESDLDRKIIDWGEWWHVQARKRFEKLTKEKRVQTNQLWIESINELDMDNWLGASGL